MEEATRGATLPVSMENTPDTEASAAVESWSRVYPLKAVVTEAEPAPLITAVSSLQIQT